MITPQVVNHQVFKYSQEINTNITIWKADISHEACTALVKVKYTAINRTSERNSKLWYSRFAACWFKVSLLCVLSLLKFECCQVIKDDTASLFADLVYALCLLFSAYPICLCLAIFLKIIGYLLPIVNKLLVDKELLSKPPYALVLLPSIELCHQVSCQLTKLFSYIVKIYWLLSPKKWATSFCVTNSYLISWIL